MWPPLATRSSAIGVRLPEHHRRDDVGVPVHVDAGVLVGPEQEAGRGPAAAVSAAAAAAVAAAAAAAAAAAVGPGRAVGDGAGAGRGGQGQREQGGETGARRHGRWSSGGARHEEGGAGPCGSGHEIRRAARPACGTTVGGEPRRAVHGAARWPGALLLRPLGGVADRPDAAPRPRRRGRLRGRSRGDRRAGPGDVDCGAVRIDLDQRTLLYWANHFFGGSAVAHRAYRAVLARIGRAGRAGGRPAAAPTSPRRWGVSRPSRTCCRRRSAPARCAPTSTTRGPRSARTPGSRPGSPRRARTSCAGGPSPTTIAG